MKIAFSIPQRIRRRIALALTVALVCVCVIAVVRVWPRAPLAASFASSIAVYDATGKLLRLTLSDDDKYRLWTPLKDISPLLVEATLLHEDRHFRKHVGVNPFALTRGAWRTYFTRERRQGGSTITMQLARLKYGMASRTIGGKVQQVLRALQLEAMYGKDDILEAYLNLVPYGGNIEGVGAGSLIYFGKRAEKLTLPEALALTVIPQSPARRGLSSKTDSLWQARAALFNEWVAAHPHDAAKAAQLATPITLRAADDLPFAAPHAVEAMLANARQLAPTRKTRATEIRATIDLRQQRLLERQLRAYVNNQQRVGIKNAAAMLLDTRTMAVKAMVGSADFFNSGIEGQVNGTLGKRSPGSTLKPFVYALGIDQGVLHPATILRDAPSAFGPFSPENFDGQFVGPISAKDALIKSRNIPAVQVAAKLNKPSVYEFLKTAGVARMREASHYGLGLVLGGGEVTMEELVALYAALANGGELKPIRYDANEPAASGRRLLSEEASYITLDMLKDNPRPHESALTAKRVNVHWKTGTSYGFRDAWSVGVFGPYVLAVWIGNFDGEANPAFVGVEAAAPLFFQMIDAIVADQPLPEITRVPPKRVTKIEVCAASGDLPNADCPQKTDTWFVPGVSPIRVSTIHRKLAIDKRTGLQACAPYRADDVRFETYEYWPSDLQKLFREAGMPRRNPPNLMPHCTAAQDNGAAPRITQPLRGVTYTLREARVNEETVTLSAVTDGDAGDVFWFADQTFIGRAKAGTALAWKPPGAGNYMLRAVDDQGRADVRELPVAVVR
jgi:penicillin-binding protein 1C